MIEKLQILMRQSKQSNIVQAESKLKIVLTGGGSGGHITPLLAVAEELKKLKPEAKLIFIGQKGDRLSDVPAKHKLISSAYFVRAGKFRRYHGEGIKQLLDIKTMFKNIRDFFYVIVGVWQSLKLLKKIRPDIIFVKGGFVGVPVGLSAAWLHIPYVTHDSDALPGLANRIISRWAAAHAVALPKDAYSYPKDKTFTVGVPVNAKFRPVSSGLQKEYKKKLGLKPDGKVLLITGGGNGAQRLNEAITEISPILLNSSPELYIIHATGREHEQAVKTGYAQQLKDKSLLKRINVKGYFVDDLYINSGAADLIVTRAGATNIAELAAQHKACIIVPNPILTGGHQLKNAKYLTDFKAAIIFDDNDLANKAQDLARVILDLLNDSKRLQNLGENLAHFAKPRAAKELAELLIDTIA